MSLKECLDRDGVLLQVRLSLLALPPALHLLDVALVLTLDLDPQRAGVLDPPSSEARFLGVGSDDKSPAYTASGPGTDYLSSVPIQRRGTFDSGFEDGGG